MQTNTTSKTVSRAHRTIFFEAVILTLLIHGLLLVFFVYAPPPQAYSNVRTASVTFMSLSNQNPEKRRQLLNWLEYHEPSLISAPNAKYGYNQLNPYIDFREVRPDRKYQLVLPEARKNSIKKFTGLELHAPVKNDLAQNLIFHPLGKLPAPPEPASSKLPPTEIKYPLIKHNDSVLQMSLTPSLEKRALALQAKPMTVSFHWGRVKLVPRMLITASSGNRDFDLEVLRELRLKIDEISPEHKDFRLNIQWRKEASE